MVKNISMIGVLLLAAGLRSSDRVTMHNPYAISDQMRRDLEANRTVWPTRASSNDKRLRLEQLITRRINVFQGLIELSFLGYHKIPGDIYSGRRKESFDDAVWAIRNTPAMILNSECMVGLRTLSCQIALLADPEIVRWFLFQGFDPNKVHSDKNSLRSHLISLRDVVSTDVQKYFYQRCLDVIDYHDNHRTLTGRYGL